MEYIQRVQAPPLSVCVHPSLEIKDGRGGERGVFVKHDIPCGEVLVKVPRYSLFTLDSVREDDCPALRSLFSISEGLREDDVLAIALLYERFGRPCEAPSKWAAHLDVLPTGRLLNAINLSSTAIQRLEGSSLHALVGRQQEQVLCDYAELSALPMTVGDMRLSGCEWWSVENYRWALSMIHSRFVSVGIQPMAPPRKAMAPFFDLFNHSCATSPALTHGFVAGGGRGDGDKVAGNADGEDKGSLIVVAGRLLVTGEEACLSYGPHGNLKMLQLYGFALPDNPFDALDIWAMMNPAAPDFAIKDCALTRLGLYPPFVLTKQDPVLSPALLAALRIQRAQGSVELACLENALQGPLSAANERETLKALEVALTTMREALPTAREEKEGEEEGEQEEQEEQERGEEEKEEARLVRLYLQSEHALLTRGLEKLAALQGQQA